MIGELRLALVVEVQSGSSTPPSMPPRGEVLLAALGRDRWLALLRGDIGWASEANMARAEQEGLAYLFKLRTTRNVKRLLERANGRARLRPAGQSWGKARGVLQPDGWSRACRWCPRCCVGARAGRGGARGRPAAPVLP